MEKKIKKNRRENHTHNINTEKQDKYYKNYIEEKINEFNTNGKQTILYFCDTYYPIIDGVIKVLDNYATLISDRYNVVVVVPKHKNSRIVSNPHYLVIGTASIYFKFVNYDLAFPDNDTYLKSTLKKLKVHLIHAHSPFNMGIFARKLAQKLKIPFIMTLHSRYKQDFYNHTKNEAITKALLKNIMKVYNKSDEVWTMHDLCIKELISYGYKGKIYKVPNATDYEIPSNPEKLESYVNEKYNLAPNDLVFLFVGRLVKQKNILFIVESLKLLKDKNIKFKMFFVGPGPDEAELKAKIKELGMEEDVILTGKIMDREKLFSFYQRANLFLFPSTYDASSIVQIEAAAYKTPGVFIEGCVTANGIVHNQNGFLSKETHEDFAQVILNAISDKENLKRVSENAQNDLYINWKQVSEIVKDRYDYHIKRNAKKQEKINNLKELKKEKTKKDI